MTTDNRVTEPTEAQIQRATIEYREHFFRRSDGTTRICVCGVTTEGLAEFSEHRMRAALAALAPALSDSIRIEPDHSYIYWLDQWEGCWVAYKRGDCVGEEELPAAAPASAEPECGHPNHGNADHDCKPFRAEPSEDELFNPVYDIITDVLDEYTDMGVRHEVAVEIIDRVRIAGAWPTEPSEDEREVCDLCGGYNYVCFTKDTKCPKCNGR